ncbi:hypothetical protein JQM66_01765 [Oscillibacter valericigenes]|uniref:hypothetical protein n=1 Tax=Oscillibacter valericigenes TaxID=351091 RepID=UPI001F340722|nr:hypothetical protein [Oscillibacter valericigenes]MCF2663283.1 hypothetical protein [Oscillibacter valericigenes]
MEWLLFPLVFLLGGIIAVLGANKKEKAEEQARNEWNAEEEKYEAIIRKLPSDLVNKLFDFLKQACKRINRVVPDSYPVELTKMALAAGTVVKNESFGAVTREQHRQISRILDENLDWVVNTYIPAANQALMKLADTDGLGFGLITNSAADAMLYSALDTHQRLKGNEKKIREYEEAIDKQLIPIFEKIRQIVS